MPTKTNATAATRRRAERLVLTLQKASRSVRLPSDLELRRWAGAALTRRAAVALRIVGEREGRELNHRHRGRDYATNVLTFVYEDLTPLTGDIALCAPVIAREARAQGKTLEAHYAHLVVHGMLHLQGYDHERPRDARVMEARERAILRRLGYPDPYLAIDAAA